MDQDETADTAPITAEVIHFPVHYRQGENQTADWFRSLPSSAIKGVIILAGDDE